jgi:hypothetical protein
MAYDLTLMMETMFLYTAEKFQIQQRTSCFDTKCDARELEILRENSRAACLADCVD